MVYIEAIGFIATMVSLMLSLLEQQTFGRWFGYSTYTTTKKTVFDGRPLMAIGRLCNYSLVRLRWLLIIHFMVIVTTFLQLTLLIPTFYLGVIPYYEGGTKELLQDYLSGEKVVAIFIRNGVNSQDLVSVNILIVFYFIPLLICVFRAIYDVSRSIERPNNSDRDRDEFIAYVLATAVYSFMLTLGYVLVYSFHIIVFFIVITLVYLFVSWVVYRKYYGIFKSDATIIAVDSLVNKGFDFKQITTEMVLYLKDGTVVNSNDVLFYPILGDKKNDILVLFKDSTKVLTSEEISKLEVKSNIVSKLRFPFIRLKGTSESVVKEYNFD